MADDKRRDWVDTASKLLIPIVIFGVGLMFSIQKNSSDKATQEHERDTNYLKLLASQNEQERTFALSLIKTLQDKHQFPSDLLPPLQALCKGLPSDPGRNEACGIVEVQEKEAQAQKQAVEPAPKAETSSKANGTVFIQIANEEQRALAGELRGKLQAGGFTVEGIQLVAHGTLNSYVRYFGAQDLSKAKDVLAIMKQTSIDASAQDFTGLNSNSKIPPGQLEVWIGQNQAAKPH